MITLTQIPIQCPKDGYYMFRFSRETYDVNEQSSTQNTEGHVCQKCELMRFVALLKSAGKIAMLKKEDIRDRR